MKKKPPKKFQPHPWVAHLLRKRKPHKTTRITVGDKSADIDVEIAPLVKEIWKAGITDTYGSCQEGSRGRVHIQFLGCEALCAFLNIVGNHTVANRGMCERMVHPYYDPDCFLPRKWWYRVTVDDWEVEAVTPETDPDAPKPQEGYITVRYNGIPDFVVISNVYFPKSDLPAVLKHLQEHNRKKKLTPAHSDDLPTITTQPKRPLSSKAPPKSSAAPRMPSCPPGGFVQCRVTTRASMVLSRRSSTPIGPSSLPT